MRALSNHLLSRRRRVSLDGLTPGAHTHEATDVIGLLEALGSKAPVVHNHDDVYYTKTLLNAGQLDTRYYTETEINSLLTGKSDVGHNHNDLYYSETEVDGLIASRALANHHHERIYYQGVSNVPNIQTHSDGSISLLRETGELIRDLEGTAVDTANDLGNIIANASVTFRISPAHVNATAVNTAVGNIATNANLATDQYAQWYTYNPSTGVVTLTRSAVVLGLVKVSVQNTNAGVNSLVQLMRTGGPVDTLYCGGVATIHSVMGVCVMNLAGGNTIWLESNAAASNTLTLNGTWSHFTLIALEL